MHLSNTKLTGSTKTLRGCVLALALVSASLAQVKTDTGIYVEPALPALPAAGGKVIDPVFGTTIMRLTDQNDGNPDCRVLYSYWPSFNVDSTYVMAQCIINGRETTKVWRFDPNSFTRGAGSVIDVPTPSGWSIGPNDAIWSGVDPNILFGHPNNAQTINATNVTTRTNVMIKDLTGALPAGARLLQMSKSADDNVFAFHINAASGARYGYIVWRRDTNMVMVKTSSTVDEVHVDKTGRYLVVVDTSGADRIWDLSTSIPTDLGYNSSDQGFFHYAAGSGSLITAYWGTTYNCNALGFRQLSSPRVVTRLLSFSEGGQDMHYSLLSKDESYATISTFSTQGRAAQAPYQNEIFQVATDGSGRVRRLAHHRSVYNDYADQPHANISMDGRFIAFNSNWGNASGRRDVLIVKTAEAPVAPPTATLTASPSSITAGQAATLAWTTTGAASVSISGIGTVAASGTATVVPTATSTYTLTATNASGAATASGTVTVTAPAAPAPAPTVTPFSEYFEAEAAVLAAPMARFGDNTASGGGYIATTGAEAGTATFTVTVPSSGTYIVWGRILAAEPAYDSLYVSVDGGTEDVWDAAETSWSSSWKWTRVNGRNGTAAAMVLNPRTFSLAAGTHRITFRGRETYTKLDRIFVTNSASAVPVDSTAAAPAPPANTATFVKVDTATRGSWQGVYGRTGYQVIGNATAFPASATVKASGVNTYTWASSTTDQRALLKAPPASGRIAGTWYNNTFTIDVAFNDSTPRQVAIYALDWDSNARSQTVTVLNTAGAVLDTRTLRNFREGQYLVWKVTGSVKIKVTKTSGANAVVSGLFID